MDGFVHGLTVIAKSRKEKRFPRGKDKRFKLELIDALIPDAGGLENITTAKRLQAEIIATDAVFVRRMDRAIQKVCRMNPQYRRSARQARRLSAPNHQLSVGELRALRL